MLGRQGANGVNVRRVLSAQGAQLRLLLLADRSLCDRADQNLLGCSVEPVRRQSTDNRPPDARLRVVERGRRRDKKSTLPRFGHGLSRY